MGEWTSYKRSQLDLKQKKYRSSTISSMILYSEKIITFIKGAKKALKEILENEVRLRVFRDRFYFGSYSYPIHIVIYQSKNVLGYFNAPFYEIGINEVLLNAPLDELKNILRHEMAHYLTYIKYGSDPMPHGDEFNECCKKYGWGKEVSKSSICVEKLKIDTKKEAVFRKVQKLMALSTSRSKNEAEIAMLKSRELLLKQNLSSTPFEEAPFVLLRVFKQKRKTAKMDAIAKILETFFVSVVYHKVSDGIYLEILGEKASVEVAVYVANVLDIEFEKLWERAPLKGKIAKNSFFIGIAKGFCDKVQFEKNEIKNALMVVEGKLSHAKQLAYKRLSSVTSALKSSHEASQLGQKAGRDLKIHPAVGCSKKERKYLI